MLKEKLYNNDSITIGDMLTEKIAKIGENMNIRRFARFEGIIEGYIHGGGRIGVLVKFETDDAVAQKQEFKIFAKDIAMQVAASSPQFIGIEDVDPQVLQRKRNFNRTSPE